MVFESKKRPFMDDLDEDGRKEMSAQYIEMGVWLREQGHLEPALDDFETALFLDPTNIDAWNNRGCVLGEMATCEISAGLSGEERMEEALASFERALEIDPNDGVTWSNKGNALLMLGKVGEALECHDRAVELSPDNSSLWFNLGLALVEAEYYAEALHCFDKAVEIDPKNKQAWLEKYQIHRRWDELWEMSECVGRIEMIEKEEEAERERREKDG